MTDRLLSQWPAWRDKAILELRMKNVPGDKIGEILTEVETHVRESGESPDDAFGNPVAYARERLASVEVVPHNRSSMITSVIGGAVGGFVLAHSAWQLGAGQPVLGGIPAWIGLLVGVAALALVFRRFEPDLITDPRTGHPRTGHPLDSMRSNWVILVATFGGAAVVLVLAGWFLAR